jgi:predicted deacylase
VAALAGILPADGLPADGAARPHLPIFEEVAGVLSDRPGLWFPEVGVGASVSEGTRLGRVEDAFGDTVWEVLAPAAGVLTFGLGSLAAHQGDLLAYIARPMPGT